MQGRAFIDSAPDILAGNVHNFVRLRFTYAADADLKSIGWTLERLLKLRNQADYDLAPHANFASQARAQQAINDAKAALAVLEALEADPVH